MQVQRIQNNNYNTNFTGKNLTEEFMITRKILNVIQKNIESSDLNTRSKMQSILHNISIKENLPDTLKQQAKNLLLKSYM